MRYIGTWMLLWSMSAITADSQPLLTFHPPNAWSTTALSISDSGMATGHFSDGDMSGKTRGYVRNGRGEFELFDAPGAFFTQPYSVNASGDVTGDYSTSLSTPPRGFIRSRGSILTFSVPGAAFTTPYGINSSGEVVGFFATEPPTKVLGFIRRANGEFLACGLPTGTQGFDSAIANCINDGGEVAGTSPILTGPRSMSGDSFAAPAAS